MTSTTTNHVIERFGIDTVTAIELATGICHRKHTTAPAGLWHEASELRAAQAQGKTGTTIGDMARYYLRAKLAEAEARMDSPTPVLPDEHFQGASD